MIDSKTLVAGTLSALAPGESTQLYGIRIERLNESYKVYENRGLYHVLPFEAAVDKIMTMLG